MSQGDFLSGAEIARILAGFGDEDVVIVGGQAAFIWSRHYALDPDGLIVSRDLDFVHTGRAAERLAASFYAPPPVFPTADDATPNSSVVTIELGGRAVTIDFLTGIAGVETGSLMRNAVRLEATLEFGATIEVTVMHPLHLLASRLANINQLRRHDERTVDQARVSIDVLRRFVGEMVELGLLTEAMWTLRELEFVIRDRHAGRASHRRFGDRLNIVAVLAAFLDDAAFDQRWREGSLRPTYRRSLTRLERKLGNR
ncbi:hypothetical protein [Prosthecodimorpha staleyi]|uniref:Uncharacterized protein n=1 Tax=Prosthecodimorpha staleyi TaxID=2840188 RepID=A0A947GB96_9HYPH|nr:hypothetical protein [Prosthecodimorpha staleyi]MBT9287826.1 hypothetical protein [Prosthecodimorpha staleyi]